MNELLFLGQVFFTIGSQLMALALGKEALVATIALQGILSNLFIAKQISLFSLDVTACDAFTIGVIFGLNLLQEHFGIKITKKAIFLNFFLAIVYVIFSQLHLCYLPNSFDTMDSHYSAILSLMPRITIASIFVYILSQAFDAYLYAFFKQVIPQRAAFLRSAASMSISQLFDTILFSILGLYGVVEHIIPVIIVSFMIKILTIALISPCTALSYSIKTLQKRFNI